MILITAKSIGSPENDTAFGVAMPFGGWTSPIAANDSKIEPVQESEIPKKPVVKPKLVVLDPQ